MKEDSSKKIDLTKFDSEEEICDNNSCFAMGTSFYMKLNFLKFPITLNDLQFGSSPSSVLGKCLSTLILSNDKFLKKEFFFFNTWKVLHFDLLGTLTES